MRFVGALLLALAGCISQETDQAALVAAQMNATISKARTADFRAYILASDARQRANLNQIIDLTIEAELVAATTTAESRPVVDPEAVKGIIAAANAKRTELFAQLDREREMWLNDPKARQQERLDDMLIAYAKAHSEFSAFVSETLEMVK